VLVEELEECGLELAWYKEVSGLYIRDIINHAK